MADIFDEVGEDLRRDRLKRFWQKYAVVVIGAAVLIVAGTAAWRGYETWTASRAAEAGDRFLAALKVAEDGDHAAAITALGAFAGDAPADYALLARFRIAGEHLAAGETDAALAGFDALAADAAVPAELRDVARVRAAMIAVDSEDLAAVRKRVEGLDTDTGPWRHAAREIVALAAVKAEKWDEARAALKKLMDDPAVPQEIRSRGQILSDVVAAAVGRPDPAPGAGS